MKLLVGLIHYLSFVWVWWWASTCCVTCAFQVSPAPAVAASSSDKKTKKTALHTHEFWRKERSSNSIEAHILSCLSEIEDDSLCTNAYSVQVVSAEPPLVVIHDFLSKRTCEQIIQTANNTERMQRSTLGATQTTGGSIRTSSTVWLKDDEDSVTDDDSNTNLAPSELSSFCTKPLRLIASKLSSISGLPASHMENLQVVRYQPGEQFQLHTDHQDSFNELTCRGRLATCLIYLQASTVGGETWFPGVCDENDTLSIAPTQGSAVFFWNTIEKPGVVDYDPRMFLNTDLRMRHAGLPVQEGEKWVCNRWIHPIDFGAGVRGV